MASGSRTRSAASVQRNCVAFRRKGTERWGSSRPSSGQTALLSAHLLQRLVQVAASAASHLVAAGCWGLIRGRLCQTLRSTARRRRAAAARGRQKGPHPLHLLPLLRRMVLPMLRVLRLRVLLRLVRLLPHRPQPPQRQLLSQLSRGKWSCSRLQRGRSSTKEAFRRTSGDGVLPK